MKYPPQIFQLIFVGSLLLGINSFSSGNLSAAEGKLRIVATQTIFADLVKQIGQDRVSVEAIASPKFNIHFIQPKPSDVRRVTRADLYVNAGLDLEAWSDPLLEAAGRPELFRNGPRNCDLSRGIELLNPPAILTRAAGDLHVFGNPHFHMDPRNARPMVKTILAKLNEIDPENTALYEKNARRFLARLAEKIKEWKTLCAQCVKKEIISYHDDILYFARFLDLTSEEFLEPKPGIPPSPKHLEYLIQYSKSHKVAAVVLPTYYSRKEAERLAKRIGTKVLTIAHAVGEIPGAEDFFSFFDTNVKTLSQGVER